MRTLLAIRTLRGGWGLLILSEARGQALVWGVRGGKGCVGGRRELSVSGHGGRIHLPVAAAQSQRGALWPLPGSDSLNIGSAMVQEAPERGLEGCPAVCASPEAALAHAIIRQWADDRVS